MTINEFRNKRTDVGAAPPPPPFTTYGGELDRRMSKGYSSYEMVPMHGQFTNANESYVDN